MPWEEVSAQKKGHWEEVSPITPAAAKPGHWEEATAYEQGATEFGRAAKEQMMTYPPPERPMGPLRYVSETGKQLGKQVVNQLKSAAETMAERGNVTKQISTEHLRQEPARIAEQARSTVAFIPKNIVAFVAHPRQAILKDPLGTLMTLSILKGVARGVPKFMSKLKSGKPLTGADVHAEIKDVPDTAISSEIKQKIVNEIPADEVIKQPQLTGITYKGQEIGQLRPMEPLVDVEAAQSKIKRIAEQTKQQPVKPRVETRPIPPVYMTMPMEELVKSAKLRVQGAVDALKIRKSELEKVTPKLEKTIIAETKGETLPLGLATQQVPPSQRIAPQPKFSFSDPIIEERFQAAKGIQKPTLAQHALAVGEHLKNTMSRTYEFMPNIAEYAPAKQALKNLEKQRGVAFDKTLRTLRGETVTQNKAQYDIFTRKVVLDDLMEEANLGHDLPFGFTKDTLTNESAKVTSLAASDPVIAKALQDRAMVNEAVKTDYIKSMKDIGFDISEKLTKTEYFRHQVLEYANLKGLYGTGKKLKTPTGRGFLRHRKGSELDINTDYLEAETEVMSQMLYDIEVAKTIRKLEPYDISSQLKATAKMNGVADWKTLIPEGHTVWQPREGNTFYMADSIPAKIAEAIMNRELEDMGVVADSLKKSFSMGKPFHEWVVKEGLAKTLDNLSQAKPLGPAAAFARKVATGWKMYVLANPRRLVKYNIRNLTGDAEAVAVGNPKTFLKVPQAVKELYDVLIRRQPMSGDMKEWFDRGGMESTLQAQELGDIKNLRVFKNLYEKTTKLTEMPQTFWKKYWAGARLSTDFREAILRYSDYLERKRQMTSNPDGKPSNFGASIPGEIMALDSIPDRAFRMSNELLGAYDEISVAGKNLRKVVYPFWSWQELNMRRYYRFLKNATHDGSIAQTVGRTIAIKAPIAALRVGRFALKATGFWTALQIYNNLVFPEEEQSLPEEVKGRPHIILGRNADGKVNYFSRIGMFGDFLEWFGLDAAPNMVSDYISGKRTLKEIAAVMIESPVNKIMGGISPFVKAPFEILLKKELFPEALHPRSMRDRGVYLARQLSLEPEYRALTGMPQEPGAFKKSWTKNIAYYSVDPNETAYHKLYDEKREFLKKLGKSGGESNMTPRGNALYYLKMAHRYGDKESEQKFLKEYISLHLLEGGLMGKDLETTRAAIVQGIKTSLRNMHPLSGMSQAEKLTFIKSLNQEERETLARAIKYYNDVLVGDTDLENE